MTAGLEGDSKVSPYRRQRESAPPPTQDGLELRCCSRLDKASVAQLTVREIARMSDGQLARVIRSVEPLPGTREYLGCYDRRTLERLVYLVRQVCRRQGY